MTTATATRGPNALTDTWIVTRRNLLRVVRNPQLVLFSTVQPIMFLVLFNYVFGGALSFGGPIAAAGDYINWLIPGILVQSAVFGSQGTALGLTEDLQAGVIDRFRSLPMSRSAVLAERQPFERLAEGSPFMAAAAVQACKNAGFPAVSYVPLEQD